MIATSPSILDLSGSICHRGNRLIFQGKYKLVIVYFVPLTWYFLVQIKTYLDSLIRYILSLSSGNSVPEVHVCLFPSCQSIFTLIWSSWLHVMRKKQKPSAGHFAGGVSGVLDSDQLALVASAFQWCASEWQPFAHFRCRMWEIFGYCKPRFEPKHSKMKGSITQYKSLEPSRQLL